MTRLGDASVYVRPATREDVPRIVWVSNSSILPNDDIGYGGGNDSPSHDASRLASAWQKTNLVLGEEVVVAEANGRIVGCVTIKDREAELELINIDVPLEMKGRGIGTRLVRSGEESPRQRGKQRLQPARVETLKVYHGSRCHGGNTSAMR